MIGKFAIAFLLVAALVLGELTHSLMIFQLRERIGADPIVALHFGALADWLSKILVATAIVRYALGDRK